MTTNLIRDLDPKRPAREPATAPHSWVVALSHDKQEVVLRVGVETGAIQKHHFDLQHGGIVETDYYDFALPPADVARIAKQLLRELDPAFENHLLTAVRRLKK